MPRSVSDGCIQYWSGVIGSYTLSLIQHRKTNAEMKFEKNKLKNGAGQSRSNHDSSTRVNGYLVSTASPTPDSNTSSTSLREDSAYSDAHKCSLPLHRTLDSWLSDSQGSSASTRISWTQWKNRVCILEALNAKTVWLPLTTLETVFSTERNKNPFCASVALVLEFLTHLFFFFFFKLEQATVQ